MKRAGQIIITLVLVVVLVGAVCAGVGIITGAQMDRIFSVMDDRYNLTIYYEYIVEQLIPAFRDAGLLM